MLTIKIKTGNSAFVHTNKEEIHACLTEVIRKIWRGEKEAKIYDSNGNNVGHFKLTDKLYYKGGKYSEKY